MSKTYLKSDHFNGGGSAALLGQSWYCSGGNCACIDFPTSWRPLIRLFARAVTGAQKIKRLRPAGQAGKLRQLSRFARRGSALSLVAACDAGVFFKFSR